MLFEYIFLQEKIEMPIRFVLAPDSFKESMTAEQACSAMQKGILAVVPDAECIHVPMADGGEGTVDALLVALKGNKMNCVVSGPLPDVKIEAYFAVVEDGQTAVIEMAKANGIHLLTTEQRNPMLTSSYGTGELIRYALDAGVKKIIIGLGGSVTNDAGAGVAQALGVQYLDAQNQIVHAQGGNLDQIQYLNISGLDPRLKSTEVIIASDVNNPLCGAQGASYVFGPQKGASPDMVKQLDQNLDYFSKLVENQLRIHVKHIAGAGAAGGLGFGLMAFAGASIQSGAELVIRETGLERKIAQADYVLTGEGSIDFQTKFGKTPWAVAQVAKRYNKPVIAFAGRVGDGIESLYEEGFSQIIGINEPDCDLEQALKNAERNLESRCGQMVKIIFGYN